MKNISRIIFAGLAIAFICSGCTSTGVQRVSVNRTRPITTKFDPDDARKTVEKMVDSMIQFPPVITILSQRRPVLDVAKLQNRTMQHIDTVSITDSIRTRLIRTGKFRFKDRSTSGTDIDIMGEENELGLVDSSKAVKAGSQLATEMYLYGAITEMKETEGRIVDQYYKITMNLKDLKTGEIVWTDEKEIRKERKRPRIRL